MENKIKQESSNVKLWLAPMEGVVDYVMRDLLTAIGGIDACVTEFIRVTDKLIPDSVFYRDCPELKHDAKTKHGTPITVQFLGSSPEIMAQNALRAIELGAKSIDINFGCPAKTVNRHDGGAALLKAPDRIYKIVETVRTLVPKEIPVSAKIRLGISDPNDSVIISEAIAQAGTSYLTVHCRTKVDFYKPPAYWEWIPKIKERVKIPIIANGDIFSVEDFIQCQKITGCDQFMIGRGALQDPFLFQKIKNSIFESNENKYKYKKEHRKMQLNSSKALVLNLLIRFFDMNVIHTSPHYAQARTKQWMRSLSLKYPEIQKLFEQVKVITKPDDFKKSLWIGIEK